MRWFTSDQHFFHARILTGKGMPRHGVFQNLEDMHALIIQNWNKQIKVNDIVYIIGDFSFGRIDETRDILSKLNGRKILIRGNHDSRSTGAELIGAGLEDVRDELIITIGNGEKVLLKHYPYAPSSPLRFYYSIFKKASNRAYYYLYPLDRGLWHIHGHHHGGPKIKQKQINVSLETWNYKPVSETIIAKIINERNAKSWQNRVSYFLKKLTGAFKSKLKI